MKLYTQQYLIICNGFTPFFSEWFEPKNNFRADLEMVVFDLHAHKYTKDGTTWFNIESDHL